MNPESPVTARPPVGLNAGSLNVPKEKSYFIWVVLVSILIWGLLAISIVGIFYALLIGFFIWLGSGLLTAYLRAEAVKVTPEQLPELHATFLQVCAQLEQRLPPALYVLQSGGLLNAFATRFSGRNFVVVYSDMLEALGPSSPEMRFILGHEIGHLKSGHITKQIFLAPGLFFPLIGPAYRRAWETSCDRYGAFAAQDVDASVRAMLILSGGREYGRRLNPAAFAGQYADDRGFFVSLHELTSTYPTLSRRVTDLAALADGRDPARAPRNPLAYLLALFIPGGGAGQGGPIAGLMMIVFIGLLAAIAIPAFQKVREASEAKACHNNQRQLASALDQHLLERGSGPQNWSDVVGAGKYVPQMPVCPRGGSYNGAQKNDGFEVTCSVTGHNPGDPGFPPARP